MREHDVTALTAAELEAARRELAASLTLARPGSPVCAPIHSTRSRSRSGSSRRCACAASWNCCRPQSGDVTDQLIDPPS